LRLVTRIALALGVALGCGNKTASPTTKCDDAARLTVSAMVKRANDRLATAPMPPNVRATIEERTKKLEELAPRLRAVVTNRCVDDKWSAAVIACYAKVTSVDEERACRDKLSVEQQAKLQKDELDLFADALGPPGFAAQGSASAATSPEVRRLEAEVRQLNTRLGEASKKVADAPSDADRQAAQAELQRLQEALAAANAALASARAQAAPPALPTSKPLGTP
jgi:hypothetical protein